ncbi:spindle assembly abnormal protein 6 homolog isoform X1 [Hydra vulgaris]|uniref:spindle assembly abnormal protein 6 homolog isoform X1 n=1 Tax=Hydra vulgaris TaxID=6087 RepID=UPI001F5E8671|nr:spindle assembly abnormal protein 6 homolog [Hydra vulgaris]
MQSEILFSKYIQVVQKEFDQRCSPLQIQVSLLTLTATHKKELQIRLTNDEDLFFLQSLTVNEEDFQVLKNEQGLLIDFNSFPKKFIDLLELCIAEQSNSLPRFSLHLSIGISSTISQSCLEVVETNPFKHLVHLSLKFLPAKNEELKAYLVDCLKKLKGENALLQNKLACTENDLSRHLLSTQKIINEQSKEIDDLRKETNIKLEEATSSLSKELCIEKENYRKLHLMLEEKRQSERETLGEQYRKTLNEYEKKIEDYQRSNKELTDQKYKYESLIRDLKTKLTNLEEEKRVTTKDLQYIRRQNTALDSERHERDKTLNHLRTRVAVLEQELKDKDQVVKRTNELNETSAEQKRRLEIDLEEKSNAVLQLDATIQSVSKEVMKGNEIIQKLQTELKATKSRMKMINVVMTKQERLIEEKDIIVSQKEKELKDFDLQLCAVKEENKVMKKKFEETNQKLNESQEELKNNENVINWLNRQLNEHTINKLSSTHNATLVSSNRMTNQERASSPSTFQSGQYIQPYNTNIQSYNQIHYRPILKKPQFQSDGISPIVPQVQFPQVQTLRQKQMSTPVVNEEVIDPKYLMRKRPEELKENHDPSTETKRNSPKPLLVTTSNGV